jgi:4-hydroxybenzoate polyprenyltransferase
VFIVFVLGVLLTRSAGCVINDFADRKFDGHVKRTRQRPMATGEVSTPEALLLFAALILIAFGLVLTMGKVVVLMSLVGAFIMITYPFLKRFFRRRSSTGLAFSWSIPMSFVAQTGRLGCAGCCSRPALSGQQRTTPCTPWWIARTICASASSPAPSCSARPTG